MRIVIDMQGAQSESRFRGIGRYSLALAQAIVRNRGDHHVMLALSGLFPDTIEPIRAAFQDLMPQADIKVWYAVGPVQEIDPDNQLRRESAELLREAFLGSLEPDFVLITSLIENPGDEVVTSISASAVPTAVVLYDLIPLLRPDENFNKSAVHKAHYKRKLEDLKRSHLLLAISESARQEALLALPGELHATATISGACDECFQVVVMSSQQRSSLTTKYDIRKPFVMYTGGADERKNLQRLVQAFGSLPHAVRDTHQLVFAGKMPAFHVSDLKRIAASVGLRDGDVVFTGYVPNEDLVKLYNTCKGFIFPSLHEGLGLPPLEAMACGAPTIAANATSLPEVIGLDEALFDPQSVEEMTERLMQLLTDESFRKRLIDHGLQHVRHFSWDTTARLAIDAIEHAHRAEGNCRIQPGKTQQERIQNLLNQLSTLLRRQDRNDQKLLLNLSQCIADNEPCERKPLLMLDVSVIVHGDAKSGIQRVVRSLLTELIQQPPQGRHVLPIYFDGGIFRVAEQFILSADKDASGAIAPAVAFASGDQYLAIDLNMHLAEAMHPLLGRMRARGVSMNFIVYDLLLDQHPEWWVQPMPELFQSWLTSISEVADRLICISDAVVSDMRDWLARHPPQRTRGQPQVLSFHLGADIQSSMPSSGFPPDAESHLTLMRKRPSLLSVGTIEPRKGQAQLLDAMEILWAKGVDANLVLVGKNGWKVDGLVKRLRAHRELNQRLFWLEGISDEYLEKVYDACSCLVAASLGEGFGLPLIEAAQKKMPILARDLPVFREVAGNHASYFHGTEAEALARAIDRWLAQFSMGEHPRSDHMPWLTWKQSATALLATLDLSEKLESASQQH